MPYILLGYTCKLDQVGAVEEYIIFLAKEGNQARFEFGQVVDIKKVSPSVFNPSNYTIGSNVNVIYDSLGRIDNIV